MPPAPDSEEARRRPSGRTGRVFLSGRVAPEPDYLRGPQSGSVSDAAFCVRLIGSVPSSRAV